VTGVKRLTRPPSGSRRIIDRLPQGMSVGSSTISAARPEHSDGRRGADGDGPGRGAEFGEDRGGPGGGQAGDPLPEGREALDVVGDQADRDEFHGSSPFVSV
jgi:hypothetical protein